MSIFARKTVSILSIDWDWFFPNVGPYDWTHNEENPLFFETIWSLRPGSMHIMDPTRVAVEEIRPDRALLDGFWERTVKMIPMALFVAESHLDLYRIVSESIRPKRVEVVNFDAHHDTGYGLGAKPNCGNWAEHFHKEKKLARYEVVYPPWRKAEPEGKMPRFVKVIEPPPARRYDFVFVCRSGCWTPTWADREWLDFIGWWKRSEYVWGHKVAAPFALKERQPNLEDAIRIGKEMLESFKKLAACQEAGKEA